MEPGSAEPSAGALPALLQGKERCRAELGALGPAHHEHSGVVAWARPART